MSKEIRKITVGTDDFSKMVTTTDMFVDKSLFIKDIIDSGDEATLITRPRRWGKSLSLDMLKHFFSIQHKHSKELFSELKIANATSFLPRSNKEVNILEHYQAKHPVIHITLKDVIGDEIEGVIKKLNELIKNLYKEHEYILESEKISDYDKLDFRKYIDQDYSGITLESSIKFLSKVLNKHYDKKVYILVDEYDKPVNHLIEEGDLKNKELIKKVSLLVTKLLSNCGKSNPFLEKIVLTGIYDTLKKEGGSGFNNVVVYGILNSKYSNAFGFSEQETNVLVNNFPYKHSAEILSNITKWYNGYNGGDGKKLYTPWPVMRYLSSILDSDKGYSDPQSYWAKSGTSSFFQALLRTGSCNKENKFMHMLGKLTQDGQVIVSFDDGISLFEHDIDNPTREEVLFSYFLVNSGYLTAIPSGQGKAVLSIPNLEVRWELASVYNRNLDTTKDSAAVCKAIAKLGRTIEESSSITSLFLAIKNGNTAKIEDYDQTKICQWKKYDMTAVEYAALSGKSNIFRKLYDICSQNNVPSNNLRLGDYGFMSKSEQIMSFIGSKGETISLLEPSISARIGCELIDNYKVLTAGTIGVFVLSSLTQANVVSFISQIGHVFQPNYIKHCGVILGIGVSTKVVYDNFSKIKKFDYYQNYLDIKNIIKNNETICNKTQEFFQISEITQNTDSYSMKEFYRYRLENPDTSYVTTNGECKEGYKVISHFIESDNFEEIENGIQLCGVLNEESANSFA